MADSPRHSNEGSSLLAVTRWICRQTRVLDLDEVAPGVGLRAVEVGEPVLARQPARGERAAVAAVDLRVGRQRGDGAADEPRALRDRSEVGVDGGSVAPVR